MREECDRKTISTQRVLRYAAVPPRKRLLTPLRLALLALLLGFLEVAALSPLGAEIKTTLWMRVIAATIAVMTAIAIVSIVWTLRNYRRDRNRTLLVRNLIGVAVLALLIVLYAQNYLLLRDEIEAVRRVIQQGGLTRAAGSGQ